MKSIKVLGGPVVIAARRQVVERGPHSTSVSYVPDGTKTAQVEIWIDPALLDDLGARAMGNRGRKARLASGMIEARVVSAITHTPEPDHG